MLHTDGFLRGFLDLYMFLDIYINIDMRNFSELSWNVFHLVIVPL